MEWFAPGYSHSVHGTRKNAIDFLYHRWRNKAVGFVGYGSVGAPRSVEHLRLIAAELHLAGARDQVAFVSFIDITEQDGVNPGEHDIPILDRMLEEVVAWSSAGPTAGRDAADPLPRRDGEPGG